MRRHRAARIILHGAILACTLSACKRDASPQRPSAFAVVEASYFDQYYRYSPSSATALGVHDYDDALDDMSAAAFAARIDSLHRLGARLDAARTHQTPRDSIDAVLIGNAIDAELLELERVQGWRHNPMWYIYLPSSAVHGLIKRDFAPANQRLRSVIARLRLVPTALAAMRENMDNPPREFTDLAIRMADGSVGFFSGTVGDWGRSAAGGDSSLLRLFTAANDSATAAMTAAAKWLKSDLLPRSNGAYALGPELFGLKLRYEEMVDIPLDRLLLIGEATLARDHQAALAVARRIDSTRPPLDVITAMADDHPSADSLLASVQNSIEATRRFVVERRIATLPSDVRPRIEETPSYARTGGFASLDPPGPFETRATEAFYYVTPPEKGWDRLHTEEHLRLFNRPVVALINAHEAYPGHYLQFLYSKQFPTRTRKQLYAASNVEGWAHYSEQMMLEEGFGGGDPKIQLAQLQEALVRDCRFVVGIKLHTRAMSVRDGARCFVDQAFQEPANAYEESRRGAYNPTYLYYTLGKLQIYKLRADYERSKGRGYSLQGFHDAFLREGGMPIKLMRRLLLPGDSGASL